MSAFFVNSCEGPRAKLRKRNVEDQNVDNNTYTPHAVSNSVPRPSLQRRISATSLALISSLPDLPPPSVLSQLTLSTRALLSYKIRSNSAPLVMNIGKPKFVKRNDSPIFRFPSQKEELLVEGVEKLVQLEGDVIPGPGVKLKAKDPEMEPEPKVEPVEVKKTLKVVNLPNSDIRPAFLDNPRLLPPPPKPLSLAASRPVPLRSKPIPLAGIKTVAPLPTKPSSPLPPTLGNRANPQYRGVAPFRFNGSIPGPSPESKELRPLPGMPTRAKSTKLPAIRVSNVSPLSQEFHLNSLPPAPRHLTVPHSWQNGREQNSSLGEEVQRRGGVELSQYQRQQDLAQASDTENNTFIRRELVKIVQQNISIHNRLQAFEENTMNDKRMFLHRIIALEKADILPNKQSKVNHRDISGAQIDADTRLAAHQEQNAQLRQANEELTAQVEELKIQNEDLTNHAALIEYDSKQMIDHRLKAKEIAEASAKKYLKTIEALENQNNLDRKRVRDEKNTIRIEAKAELAKYIGETNVLQERLATQETESVKHIEESKLKEDELAILVKESENLRMELKILWDELGNNTKKVEAASSKKISDIEAELASAKERRGSDAIEKDHLRKEIEVLWAEIRDMHEKLAAAKLAKSALPAPSSTRSHAGKSNTSSWISMASRSSARESLKVELSPLELPDVNFSPQDASISPVTIPSMNISPVDTSPLEVPHFNATPGGLPSTNISPVSTPLDTSPLELPKVNTSPVGIISVSVSPVEVPQMIRIPPNIRPVNNSPVSVPPAKISPVAAAPVITSPVITLPVNISPIEKPPVDISPVRTHPVNISPVKTSQEDALPVRDPMVDMLPINKPSVNTSPVKTLPVKIQPAKIQPVKIYPSKIKPVKTYKSRIPSISTSTTKAPSIKAPSISIPTTRSPAATVQAKAPPINKPNYKSKNASISNPTTKAPAVSIPTYKSRIPSVGTPTTKAPLVTSQIKSPAVRIPTAKAPSTSIPTTKIPPISHQPTKPLSPDPVLSKPPAIKPPSTLPPLSKPPSTTTLPAARPGTPVPERENLNQPDFVKMSQSSGIGSLRHKTSTTSVRSTTSFRFRQNAMMSTEELSMSKATTPRTAPMSPLGMPMNRAKVVYGAPVRQRVRQQGQHQGIPMPTGGWEAPESSRGS